MAFGEDVEMGEGSGDSWRENDRRSGGGNAEDGAEEVREELLSAAGSDAGTRSNGGESPLPDIGEG